MSYAAFQRPEDSGTDFAAQSFLVNRIINRLATTALVKVMKVTSIGQVAPVGLIDVSPMVHQVDGIGDPTPHGIIHNVPYFRMQGGTDAIIMDPKVGDIGIAVFCSRDISAVIRTKVPSNPSSARKYDWADALYIGGCLNAVPQQYFQFSASGINVVSPTKITLVAPNVEIDGTVTVVGNVATTGTLRNNAHDVGSTHRHTASGGSGTGGPPV